MPPAAKKSAYGLLAARRSFVTILKDRTVTVHQGDLYAENDPIVAKRRELFGEPRVRKSGA